MTRAYGALASLLSGTGASFEAPAGVAAGHPAAGGFVLHLGQSLFGGLAVHPASVSLRAAGAAGGGVVPAAAGAAAAPASSNPNSARSFPKLFFGSFSVVPVNSNSTSIIE